MPSPSDLLKKANSAEYVVAAQDAQRFKNPAYYMQPPTANASVWSGEPVRTSPHASEWAAWPQAAQSKDVPATPPPEAAKPAPAESHMTIRPPVIPRQYIPQKHSVYAELMKKHDRVDQRHLGNQSGGQ